MKRIVTVLCALVLLITSFTVIPVTSVEAESHSIAQSEVDEEYVSDPSTLNDWERYFTSASTEYAGAVWTDKSVFTNDQLPFTVLDKEIVEVDGSGNVVIENDAIKMTKQEDGYTLSIGQNNFLIAMSALASTKQITGYSALPSDTVIVLDLSNSMGGDEMHSMVEATNKAIAELFELNKHNRVGVAVYATNAYELLPIERYTTTKTATDGSGASYPVYVELYNFSAGDRANTGQIRTARDSQSSRVDLSGITDDEWTAIVQALREVRGGNNYDRRLGNAIQANLISAGAVIPEGSNIDWEEVADDRPNGWNVNEWKEYLSETNHLVSSSALSVVVNSNGTAVTKSVNVGGATYIQGGLDVAEGMFKSMDTVIETGLVQAGTKRIPIFVLMSDGAPTYSSTSYTNPTNENRNQGDGTSNSTNDRQVFPTQLTAAYVKKTVEEYYGRDSLFYTLGLGVGSSGEALRVLNPYYNTNNTIESYWTGYHSANKGESVQNYPATITKVEDTTDSSLMKNTYRYYADEYFEADDADDLIDAFDDIVQTIIIQSKYYPTLVEEGLVDLDGYVTLEDEIGGFMQVEEIKGMLLGETIFTGDAFLKALTSEAFGNASEWTKYGDELLKSIAERLHLEENEARTLLSTAWRADGQLQTENYIGWYADEDGKYLGFWDAANHTEANYPAGTAYLNKCYLFQGELNKDYGSVAGSDMMHIIVQVHEEVATGHQSVIWKIPASLVPLATYSIDIDTNSLETATDIKLSFEANEPIRLLYEVKLNPEINSVNLLDKVGNIDTTLHHNHPVKDGETTVGYAFYSNRWGEGHTLDGSGNTSILDPNSHLATVAHFHPSYANERYYYVEDSIIYTDTNGTEYNSSSAPTGSDYYHAYRLFETTGTATGTKDPAKITTKYIPISSNVITKAESNEDGTWYIPAGEIYQAVARLGVAKTENKTGTLGYADYPVIAHPSETSTDYHVYNKF